MTASQVQLFKSDKVAPAVCTSGKTLKGENWHIFDGMPKDPKELAAYYDVIRQVIFSKYMERKKLQNAKGVPAGPIYLQDIFEGVLNRINDLRSAEEFPYAYHVKRWVDRRVNEVACPKTYKVGEIPRIICATAGFYQPNPLCFDDSMIFAGEMTKAEATRQLEAYWENERKKNSRSVV